MRSALAGLAEFDVFGPDDLHAMQVAFDAACRRLDGAHADGISHRMIASVIVHHYELGLREPQTLAACAVDAARGAHGATPFGAIVWRWPSHKPAARPAA